MNKNTIIGLVLLVVFALAVLGGIFNGSFAQLGDKNIGYYLGYFGTLVALVCGGVYFLCKKPQ